MRHPDKRSGPSAPGLAGELIQGSRAPDRGSYRSRVVEQRPRHVALSPPHDDYTDLLLKSVPEMEVGWLEQVL